MRISDWMLGWSAGPEDGKAGSDPDPDGYSVTVDGGTPYTLAPNETLTLAGFPAGDHTVLLDASTVAVNCTVNSTNPQTVTVPQGGTGTATFAVSCVPLEGDLDVTTSTTGSDLDADGYTFSVDGGAAQAIGINETITLTGLSEGDHSVLLDASTIAANCTLNSTNPQTVSVPFGGTGTATFDVSCDPVAQGQLQVGTIKVSGGPHTDPDGVTITATPLAGGTPVSITGLAINASHTFSGLSAGSWSVSLSSLSANCRLESANPVNVSVSGGGLATHLFSIHCNR